MTDGSEPNTVFPSFTASETLDNTPFRSWSMLIPDCSARSALRKAVFHRNRISPDLGFRVAACWNLPLLAFRGLAGVVVAAGEAEEEEEDEDESEAAAVEGGGGGGVAALAGEGDGEEEEEDEDEEDEEEDEEEEEEDDFAFLDLLDLLDLEVVGAGVGAGFFLVGRPLLWPYLSASEMHEVWERYSSP